MKLLYATLLLSLAGLSAQQEKVKVTLFQESLCPDCTRFFTNQLYPAYKKIGNNLDMDLLPYGKASHQNINGVWQFKCQHGAAECYGNKVQACVQLQYPIKTTMDFVGCIMGKPNPSSDTYIKQCATSTNVSWDKISKCLTDGTGDAFLAKLGDRTNKVKPANVPQIWFNDRYDKTLENQAIRGFLVTVCKLFKQKPTGC